METQTLPLSWKRDRPREPVDARSKKKGPVDPEEEATKVRMMAEARAAWEKRTAEAKDRVPRDRCALQAIQFRETWNQLFSGRFGDFEDTTKIRPMRFTDNPAPPFTAFTRGTLQIFSVKVTEVGGGLQWPLHVFGIVALRDAVDNNRNVIFCRERENCQILTQKDPCLALTGPTRAVVMLRPVTFEVKLTVKGGTESEDKDLSYLAVPLVHATPLHSCLLNTTYTSKLSTLEFTHGHLCYSVEATISVRVIDGSWNGFRCQFFTCTASINEEVLLLDSGDKEVPVSGDGKINLSREVVSVELKGKLMVYVKAWDGDIFLMGKGKDFTPKKAGRSRGMLNVGSCKMQVTVAWSLISTQRPTENSL